MILVDTSVWIRALMGREPWRTELDRLLGFEMVAGHELVYGELLIGDTGGRGVLLAAYSKIHQAPRISHPEVVRFVQARRLYGRGIGWIDVHLLASALAAGITFWTADARCAVVADELGIAVRA